MTAYIAGDVRNLLQLLRSGDLAAYKKNSVTAALRFLTAARAPLDEILRNKSTATSEELLRSGQLDGEAAPEATAFYSVLLGQCVSETHYYTERSTIPELVL